MNNLNKILDKAVQYLEKSEGFLNEQVPEFCKQLMTYHAWGTQVSYDISFWFALLFFVICMGLVFKLMLSMSSNEGECVVALVCCGCVFLVSFCIAVSEYKSLKMYKIAPKVFLIKTIKDLAVK